MLNIDPIEFGKLCWPHVSFYREQKDIIYSVRNNDETYVPAGNMLGKDFVAAFITIWFFVSRHPCKIVTTSVKDMHLNVLWGEIAKFVRTSKYPLEASRNGPLLINNNGMRKVVKGQIHKDSYVMRMVATERSMESFQGHHVTPDPGEPIDNVPRNMFVADEASGLLDMYYQMASTWAKRMFIFGNTWPCMNFFYRAVKGTPGTDDVGGDLKAPGNGRYYRKVIQIRGKDSSNVRFAQSAIKKHKEGRSTREEMLKAIATVIVPGILTYEDYEKRRSLWDPVRQCVSLDAEFYEGAEVLMFPPTWLDRAEKLATKISGKRQAEVMGVDSAQGGDNTSWAIVDDLGLIELISKKTPDTSVIPGETIFLMNKYGIKPGKVFFDAGGGGQQHVDRLRSQGFNVQAIAFGGVATPVNKFKRHKTRKEKGEADEVRAIYKNRRSEMYGLLMDLLDPMEDGKEKQTGFALPSEIINHKRSDGGPSLRQQLAPIPKEYGAEGMLELRPKNKRNAEDTKPTLVELIGCSPDEADSLALAAFGLVRKRFSSMARAF